MIELIEDITNPEYEDYTLVFRLKTDGETLSKHIYEIEPNIYIQLCDNLNMVLLDMANFYSHLSEDILFV